MPVCSRSARALASLQQIGLKAQDRSRVQQGSATMYHLESPAYGSHGKSIASLYLKFEIASQAIPLPSGLLGLSEGFRTQPGIRSFRLVIPFYPLLALLC